MALETIATIETTGKGIGWLQNNVIKPRFIKSKLERQEMLDKINSIHNELKFNGGGSIKDVIWDLKRSVIDIDTKLNGIQEDQHVALNLQGIAFWVSNEKGECVYASTNLCKLLGHSESEILGNGWAGWIIPDERKKTFDAWEFSVEHKTAFDEYYTFKKADGKLQKVWGLALHKKINGIHAGTMGKLEAIGEPF